MAPYSLFWFSNQVPSLIMYNSFITAKKLQYVMGKIEILLYRNVYIVQTLESEGVAGGALHQHVKQSKVAHKGQFSVF